MASLQDRRLQINRATLDKWSIREQLCLASAIALSGDQNWIGVSRTLKTICNNNKRPADWFSTKNCALQYGYLLENVETPKRKKRGSEGGIRTSSPATVTETPIDLIVKRLTEERIQELKEQVRKDQEEYAQIQRDLKLLRSDDVSDEQLQAMWKEIQEQKDAERVDEMKWENEMRERDQRKPEVQRNWRTANQASVTPPVMIPSTVSTTTTPVNTLSGESTDAVDMDVEDIIGSVKTQQQQQQQQLQQQQQQQQQQPTTSTSPLLSSLLKSPTTGSGASIRTTAPTITTLLTSGSIPNANQPAITLKAHVGPDKAQLLNTPISGPPLDALTIPTSSVNQQILSPSQSAPTLSSLLEKNKTVNRSQSFNPKGTAEAKNPEAINESQQEEQSKSISSGAADKPEEVTNADSDETDPNEEQQLLEVFKNIGNIDELDIDVSAVIDDEEVDFLKGVDEEEPSTQEEVQQESINSEEIISDSTNKMPPKPQSSTSEGEAIENKTEIKNETDNKAITKNDDLKIESASSDDSNDNIPLSSVASSMENKDKNSPVLKDEIAVVATTTTTTTETTSEKPIAIKSPSESKGFLKEETESTPTVASASTPPPIKEESSEQKEEKEEEEEEEVKPEEKATTTESNENAEENKVKKEESVEGAVEVSNSFKNENTDELEADDAHVTKTEEVEANSESSGVVANAENSDIEMLDEDKKQLKAEKIEQNESDEASKDKIETESDEKKNSNLEKAIKTSSEAEADESIDYVDNMRDQDESTAEVFVERPTSPQAQENSASECESTIAALPPPSIISTADTDEDSSTDVSVSTAKREDRAHATSSSRSHHQPQPHPSSPPSAHTRKSSSHDSHTSNAGDHESSSAAVRASKRSLLNVYNLVHSNKNCAVLQKALTEESKTKRSKYCKRQMDFQTIKKNIDNGTIRSMSELQRDFMLIITNISIQKDNSTAHAAALALRNDMRSIREFIPNANESDEPKTAEKDIKDTTKDIKPSSSNSSSSSKTIRTGSRKSQRITL